MSIIDDLSKIAEQDLTNRSSVVDYDNMEESPSLKGLGSIPQTDPYEALRESRQRDISTPLYQELGDLYNPSSTSVYDRRIRDIESLANPSEFRANEQSGVLKATNALLSGAISGLATALEDLGYIFDLESHFDSWKNLDNTKDNWLSSTMRDFKEDLYGAVPIYETEGSTALGQFFKFSTLRGMLDSMIGFAIPGGVVSKGIGALSKLTKIGSALNKGLSFAKASTGTKVLANTLGEFAKSTAAGAITNYAEGQMMAIELGENAKQQYIESKAQQYYEQFKDSPMPLTLETAYKLAEDEFNNDSEVQSKIGEEQAKFVDNNRWFMLTDALGLHGLIKNKSLYRQALISNPKEKLKAIKDLGRLTSDNLILQGIKEGAEEIGQNIIQMEGQYQVRKAAGTTTEEDETLGDNFWDRALKFGTSKQAIVEGLMGMVSGPGQRVLSQAVTDITSGDPFGKLRKEKAYNAYLDQQRFISTISSKINNIVQAEALKAEAYSRGDDITADAIWNKEAADLVREAVETGTIQALSRSTQDIIENPNRTPEEKEQAQKFKKFISEAENEYILASNNPNSQEIFENRLQNNLLQEWATNLQKDISQKVNELNNSLSTKTSTYSLHLDKNYKIEDSSLNEEIKAEVPEEYEALMSRISQHNDIQETLQKNNEEYKHITDSDYQKNWVVNEAKRVIDEARKKQNALLESSVNKPLVKLDDSKNPTPEKAKLVKDGDNYFLRGYDPELDAYSTPLLQEDGKERPAAINDLEGYEYEEAFQTPNTPTETPSVQPQSEAPTQPESTAQPEVKKLTHEGRLSLAKEASEISSLDNLEAWRESKLSSPNLPDDYVQTVERIYKKEQKRLALIHNVSVEPTPSVNPQSPEPEYKRAEDEVIPDGENSLWDSPKRSPENYWFGSKGSEAKSRRLKLQDQIRWYDFLDKFDITKFRGIIIPFEYEGRVAGRLVITDINGNFVDINGDSLGKTLDLNKAIYTTVADPSTDSTNKYSGSEKNFDYYKSEYLTKVWEPLKNGISIPVTFRGASSGIVDEDFKKLVTYKPAQLQPLGKALPANMNMNDLTVYISTSGQIVTEEGLTYTVPAGTAVIHNKANNNYYRANSVPIREEARQFIIELFRDYITRSLKNGRRKSDYSVRVGNKIVKVNFFELLRDLLRYDSSGDVSRSIYNKRNSDGTPTATWVIGGTEIDEIGPLANGGYAVNEKFFEVLDDFLKKAFYNIRSSKIDPKSLEPYYIPYKINKNGTLSGKEYPNYHAFVRESLVGFTIDPSSPYSHAERYAVFTPQIVDIPQIPKDVPTNDAQSILQKVTSGTPIKLKLSFNNPNTGVLNEIPFTLSFKNNTLTTDQEENGFVQVTVDQLGRNQGTLQDVAKQVQAFIARQMNIDEAEKFNMRLELVTESTPTTESNSKEETSQIPDNPIVAALKKRLSETTDPNIKAQLQIAIETATKLSDSEVNRAGTQVLQSTKFRKIYEEETKASLQELEKAKEWFTKKFPGIDFEIVQKAVLNNVAGKFENGVVTIYEGTNRKTVYHEAFHVVLNCILTPSEKTELLKAAIDEPSYKEYFDSLRAAYPSQSEEELTEEVLAEAFADYMVMEDESNSIIRKFFAKIKELLIKFYNLFRKDGVPNREWTSSLESIVERVRTRNFLSSDYLTLKTSIPHSRVIPELDAITTADAVNSVHYWFLQYFKDTGNLVEILQSNNGELLKKAYEKAYNEFVGRKVELLNSVAFINPVDIPKVLSDVDKIDRVLRTWDDANGVKSIHQQERLAQYKLELNTSEDYQEAVADIVGGEDNQGRDSAQLFAESITFSSKVNSNKIIKLLLSTLPKKYYDFATREAIPYVNSLGMPEVESFGKVFNILANKLANIPSNISVAELKKKLTEAAEEYPAIYALVRDEVILVRNSKGEVEKKTIPSWLKLDKEDEWTGSDALQIIQFLQAFTNNRNRYLIGITKKNGQYINFDAASVGQRAHLLGRWRAQLNKWLLDNNKEVGPFYKKNAKKFWEYNVEAIKKAFPKVPNADNAEEFLKVLGITFEINNPKALQDALHSKEVLDKISNLYTQIIKGTIKTPVVFENRDDENENLSAFLDIQAYFGIETLENSHISLGNERVYDITKPSFFNNVVNRLNRVISNPATLYQELPHLDPSENTYTTHSLLISRILSGAKVPKLSIYIHEGNKENSSEKAVEYKDLKLADKLATVLNLTMEGKDNVMRPADNGQERFLDHGTTWVNNTTTRREIFEIFKGYLWDELARSHTKNRAFTNLSKNYKKGTMIESLLSKEEINTLLVDTEENPTEFADRVLNLIGHDILAARITTMIDNWMNNAYSKLKDLGDIAELANGSVLNMSLKLSNNPSVNQYSKEEVLKWIKHAVVNYAIGNIEQSKILYGDNVYYKSLGDEFKRHNGAMGSKKNCLTSDGINKAITKRFKRMDGAESLVDKNGKPILRTAVFSDVISYSSYLYQIAEIVDSKNPKYQKLKSRVATEFERSDKSTSFEDMMTKALINEADKLGLNSAPYSDMTEGDGFGMISLDAYRELKVRVGDWTADSEKLYQWEVQERAGVPKEERVFTDFNGKTTPLKYGDWGNQVFNSLKPQHFGPLANVEGYKPSFYKLSLMPLIPSVLKSMGNTNLSKLHEMMINNKISVVVHYSANKGVTTKTNSVINDAGVEVTNTEHPFNDFYDNQGNFLITPEGSYNGPLPLLTQDTYWENWGIQVDTGEHRHHDVVTGTQMMVQILNGIFDAGEISAHFGEEAPRVKSLVDEYISLNNERIKLGRQQLIKELGLIASEKGWKVTPDGIETLVGSLRDEAIERGLADNYITAIELLRDLDEGTTNIDILPTREKIESILMSKAAKLTTSQKRHGTAAYQVPSTMWETKASRTYNDGKYKSSDLNFVVKNINGKPVITSMEVYLPSPFEGVTKVGQVPKELLQLIGFRIPTQGLSSIETIVVKGFLPKEAGDIIVLPTEIVAKAGSD